MPESMKQLRADLISLQEKVGLMEAERDALLEAREGDLNEMRGLKEENRVLRERLAKLEERVERSSQWARKVNERLNALSN